MEPVGRRPLLKAGLSAAGLSILAGCAQSGEPGEGGASPSATNYVQPDGPQVQKVDQARHRNGKFYRFPMTATVGPVDLGGVVVNAWSYEGRVPGREMRMQRGDTVRSDVSNRLPAPTTVHWHGLDIRNNMDGVPYVTQDPIGMGKSFLYEYVVTTPGTYYYHPHDGLQFDHGLYGPLIIEDPDEPQSYDEDWTVVFDDWIDGVDGLTPESVYAQLKRGMATKGQPQALVEAVTLPPDANSRLLGGDPGDLNYPYYLINGRVPSAPVVFTSKPGRRARIRLINAGADTAFLVALGGHRMTVTHTDGSPIEPVEADRILLGMGERYDVLVTLKDGVFPLVALAEGKGASAFSLVRTGAGEAPKPSVRPAELDGKLVGGGNLSDLKSTPAVRLDDRKTDQTVRLSLTGQMDPYVWALDGKKYDPRVPLTGLTEGRRVSISYTNKTGMWHPMHFHGHSFFVGDLSGPRKDTVIVLPGQTVNCYFDTDNPGRWVTHCHNAYHEQAGMIGVLAYRV